VDAWEVVARLDVEDTLARYTRFADGGRAGDLAALFAEDGALVVGDDERRGRRAIQEYLEGNKADLSASAAGGGRIRHHVSSLRIDLLDRDTARATSYFLAVTAAGPDHWGVYRDELVRVDDRWLIARREAIPEGAAPDGWQGTPRPRSGS
jgi:hypothetical protein